MTVKQNPLPALLTFKAFPKVDASPDPPMEAQTAHSTTYTIVKFTRRQGKVGVNLLIHVAFDEQLVGLAIEAGLEGASRSRTSAPDARRLRRLQAGFGSRSGHVRG